MSNNMWPIELVYLTDAGELEVCWIDFSPTESNIYVENLGGLRVYPIDYTKDWGEPLGLL